MKKFPPRSVACFIATYFLVLSTFSFGIPMVKDSAGRGLQEKQQQQQVDQGARDRTDTDPDDDGSTKSGEEFRGVDCPAITENNSNEQNKVYLSREGFVACLAADVQKFSQQLKFSQQQALAETEQAKKPCNGAKREKKREKKSVTINSSAAGEASELDSTGGRKAQEQQRKLQEGVFLKKIIETASRLSAKYVSEETSNEARVMAPSIWDMKSRFINNEGDSYDFAAPWPTKAMTQLEADQEYYEAFKQKEEEALQFLEQDQANEALYCHESAITLDCLSQNIIFYQEPEFIKVFQKSISLSLLLKSPEEIKAMEGDEKNAELLLFNVVTAIQEKVQNEKDASALLLLVQQYRSGNLQDLPQEFFYHCKNVLDNNYSPNKYLLRATSHSRTPRSSALSDKDPFSENQLFENKRALHFRVTQLMLRHKQLLTSIYGHISGGIEKLTEELEELLHEEGLSGPEEDAFLSLLREQSKKIRILKKETVKKLKSQKENSPKKISEYLQHAKENLLRFEAIRPFVQEEILLLSEFFSEKRSKFQPQLKQAVELLNRIADTKLKSLNLQEKTGVVWPEQEKNEYLELRKILLSEPSSSQYFFNETIGNVLVGSYITLCAALIAYELYLDSLPVSSQAASS